MNNKPVKLCKSTVLCSAVQNMYAIQDEKKCLYSLCEVFNIPDSTFYPMCRFMLSTKIINVCKNGKWEIALVLLWKKKGKWRM